MYKCVTGFHPQQTRVFAEKAYLDPGVSEMSWGSQLLFFLSGLVMGPRRMDGEKHSLQSNQFWPIFDKEGFAHCFLTE